MTTIDTANQMLEILAYAAKETPFERVLSDIDDAALRESVQHNTADALKRYDKDDPVGCFLGSTAAARDYINTFRAAHTTPELSPDEFSEGLRVLKETNRLLQVGRGRGTALVIIDASPVETNERREPSPAKAPATTARRGRGNAGRTGRAERSGRDGEPQSSGLGRLAALLEETLNEPLSQIEQRLTEMRSDIDALLELLAELRVSR